MFNKIQQAFLDTPEENYIWLQFTCFRLKHLGFTGFVSLALEVQAAHNRIVYVTKFVQLQFHHFTCSSLIRIEPKRMV